MHSLPDAAIPMGGSTNACDVLRHTIEHLAHLLPSQGPITVFVHHNTLHAFEDLPFEKAVLEGARLFGCEPYLPEPRYRELLTRGRIRMQDLATVLLEDLNDAADGLIGCLGTRYHLRLAMLQHPLHMAPRAELRWLVAETEALHTFRSDVLPAVRNRIIEDTRRWIMRDIREAPGAAGLRDDSDNADRLRASLHGLLENFDETSIEHWSEATWEAVTLHCLWRIAYLGVQQFRRPTVAAAHPTRVRDMLRDATGTDSDRLVHALLIRFCSAYLDQGFAHWPLPDRAAGFYRAFVNVYGQPAGPPDRWLHGLAAELRRLDAAGVGPLESIHQSLEALGVAEQEWERFLTAMLLSLHGFAGMIWQMETRGDRVALPAPAGSLIEFLAVRLILERYALAHVARETLGFRGPLTDLRQVAREALLPPCEETSIEQQAFLVFQLAQVLGWRPQHLYCLNREQWLALLDELEAFSSIARRRVYHAAYERLLNTQALDALATHDQQLRQETALVSREVALANGSSNGKQRICTTGAAPRFQVVCCIDDREESYRRHLEEIAPDCETFGAAAFYGIAMYYRGGADAHFVPLCPIVIRPEHYVHEEPVYVFEETHRRRAATRRAIGTASHQFHLGSRTLLGGIFTSLFGSLASIPLVARVLFPRLTARLRMRFGTWMRPPPIMRLHLERPEGTPPGPSEEQTGYTVVEMAGIVERQLRDIGLTRRFARIVIFTGHGSSSLNNPHESAYNCGACAGGRGGPNARAFAQMANDPRVRELLLHNGLPVPSDVYFVGAYHNTCNDNITFFDLERLPATHREDFEYARRAITEARKRNSHERCRRFETAPLDLSFEAALRHVESRAEDLAQTRPEYNHASNAMTIVGRRSRTRGLFLDRRAFLTSYDPTQDDEQFTILARVLQAAIPVCAGISLEYYFSTVDPDGWGCGTKLPHNVTSLLGVMTGAASDLRPGLSNQMVEIHEPVRQLFVIETKPEAMLQIMERNEAIARLCRNDWVYLAVLDPDSSQIHLFRHGRFERYVPQSRELPSAEASVDWYRGWRGHLGFARVGVQEETSRRSNPAAVAQGVKV